MFDNKQSVSLSTPDTIESNRLVGLAKHWEAIFDSVFNDKHHGGIVGTRRKFIKEFAESEGFTHRFIFDEPLAEMIKEVEGGKILVCASYRNPYWIRVHALPNPPRDGNKSNK